MDKVVSLFLPSLFAGGAEKVFLNLAGGFANSGVKTDLVLAKAEGDYLKQVPPNVNIVDLKASRVLFSLVPLIIYLRRRQPTCLLSAMNYVNIIAVLAVIIARVKTKTIITEHSTVSQLIKHSTHKYRSRIWPLLMRLFYRYADIIVAVSFGVAEDLADILRVSRQKIKVIYNPIIDEKLIEKSMEEISHPWFETGQPPVVLAAGRLTKAKDYPVLIQAFEKLRKQAHLRLIILGEGEDRPQLEKLIQDKGLTQDLAMPGYVDNPYAYMRRCAVFVLCSRFEGLPTVLVEALACGAQVVSTDCPSGPKEILEGNRYGMLVPIGDINGLCEAIELKIKGHRHPEAGNACLRYTVSEAVSQYLKLILGYENKEIEQCPDS